MLQLANGKGKVRSGIIKAEVLQSTLTHQDALNTCRATSKRLSVTSGMAGSIRPCKQLVPSAAQSKRHALLSSQTRTLEGRDRWRRHDCECMTGILHEDLYCACGRRFLLRMCDKNTHVDQYKKTHTSTYACTHTHIRIRTLEKV